MKKKDRYLRTKVSSKIFINDFTVQFVCAPCIFKDMQRAIFSTVVEMHAAYTANFISGARSSFRIFRSNGKLYLPQ